jgi:hypothetical protein
MRVICTKCGSVQDDTMLGRNCLYCCNICKVEDNVVRGELVIKTDAEYEAAGEELEQLSERILDMDQDKECGYC